MGDATRCRSCGAGDLRTFLDLGETPLADALVQPSATAATEPRFALEVALCEECSLVQILQEVPPEQLFVDNYLYFSSFSDELLRHAREHALGLIADRHLDGHSLVVEVASNDGYLLRNFVDAGVPVLGIDPAPDQAAAADAAGIPTLAEFFGTELALRLRSEGARADVVIANNVMAHVPDLNGFVGGIAALLADNGVATIENPYVRSLIDHSEFDTVYHEHHCYFSCTAVARLVERHGLHLVDVTSFPDLHGGTLRWTVSRHDTPTEAVASYLAAEAEAGLTSFGYYADFGARVTRMQADLLRLLREVRATGATVAAYGAAAKGSTLLNSTGIGEDLVEFVVDRNVHKQGLRMPGTHQPILAPEALLERSPDYVLLLAWNFRDEIMRQQDEYRRRGGRFIVPVPEPEVVGA
jgi:SAM-dependent methyltransferase